MSILSSASLAGTTLEKPKHQWKVGDRFRCKCGNCDSEKVHAVVTIDGEYLGDEEGEFYIMRDAVSVDGNSCCQKKDATLLAQAERIAAQSELLSKRAESGFTGDPRFHSVLSEMGKLHDERQQGYGTKTDPFANVRASEAWGIPAWQGAMIRGCDKIKRLQTYAETGKLNGEKVEDAFLDLANYAVIALVLWREKQEVLDDASQ